MRVGAATVVPLRNAKGVECYWFCADSANIYEVVCRIGMLGRTGTLRVPVAKGNSGEFLWSAFDRSW